MTVLAYAIETNIATHHDFLEKLKDFCQAQGWTIDYFFTNVSWVSSGGGYDFVSGGGESFLEVTSSGYGSQILNFRLRSEAVGTDPDNEFIWLTPHLGEAIDYGDNDHPCRQNSWRTSSGYNKTGFKPTDIIRAWFFGNNKFIVAVAQFDNDYCTFLSFGTPELYNSAEAQGNFAGFTSTSDSAWYAKSDRLPFDSVVNCFYYNSMLDSGRIGNNLMFGASNEVLGHFGRYGKAITKNSFSNVRPMMKPMLFAKSPVDEIWRPFGTWQIFRVNTKDLWIGEKIKYGTEEYLTFPSCKGNSEKYRGMAVRIL